MKNKITITYRWQDENGETEFSEEIRETLEERALERVYELMQEGYREGELNTYILNEETEEDINYTGWWTRIIERNQN